MQTAMNGHHKGSSTLLEKRRNGSDGMLLSRMAVDDAEVRATLLLKMQRNGQNRVEEVANEEKGLLIANGGMGNVSSKGTRFYLSKNSLRIKKFN